MRDRANNNQVAWYVAQLKPNAQGLATTHLRRQGFEVFHPVRRVTRRAGGAFRAALRPLFPGYLFVGADMAAPPLSRVNATRGVGRLVSFGAAPSPMPAQLVAGLRARCDGAGVLGELDTLGVGDRVRLLSGPFADYVARVETLDAGQRLWAVLEAARNPTRVHVLASEVEPAGHSV